MLFLSSRPSWVGTLSLSLSLSISLSLFPLSSQLMLYREVIAVCSEIHTKHINTLCGQDVELLNVKSGGTYSYYWALKC